MAKYSLWVVDSNCNRVCIPLSRDGIHFKEKVELYEIDLLTISLGKEKFIENLKKCKIIPSNFDWNHVNGYIEYKMNQGKKSMPLLFIKDNLLMHVLNVQNQYRYHQGYSESKLIEKIQENPSLPIISTLLSLLNSYRNLFLESIRQNPDILINSNLSQKFIQKLYSCIQSNDYEERREYENDILKNMLSYMSFRRLKVMEYGSYVDWNLVNLENVFEFSEQEKDPDEEAFLSEDEKKMMYG